ncbi:RNB domain-containing ribonuclease [Sulfurovum sp. ST-21]|uniref:VacB/RNase II family 3'-5' exoribonuclease n=1 Tax=Sulfurovum indicum TaxID=2779528 RepID=A0A7M1S3G4_9BACT|nr:ribonuclease R family protein [Sulfurovum indicum]QOR61541.1 VacB/RNase II family 3'-5' exoribonuclease [Sulfurovum indicum]
MSAFAVQLINGCLSSDIEEENKNAFRELQHIGAVEERNGLWKLNSLYRAGRLYISNDGRGYVEAEFKEQKDLLIEPDHLGEAKNGDVVVAKRIIARRGRASGKVVAVIQKAHLFSIAYTHRDEEDRFSIIDLRTGEPTHAVMPGMDIKAFKVGTVMKVDIDTDEVLEVFGHLGDPKIDEKISLALYNRHDLFPPECIREALGIESEVTKSEHSERIDLTHLDFCTIDPVTAKDFDDAIYFDMENYTLYVAIADVSHYVPYFTHIDKEAKKRGFTTYLPHKSFPMLPRELSENICSLKPKVDRLAFVAKITLEKGSLKPLKEEFFEAIIHSRHRFNYDAVDDIISKGYQGNDQTIARILHWLMPLQKITQRLRKERLKHGFDFRSEEIKLTINENHELVSTQIETGTPSHSLIEECMLLANQAAAKRFSGDGDGIFRIHEPPQLSKIESLLTELAAIGLYVEEYEESPDLIRAIQKEAEKMGLSSEVDAMIIKSLRQASYSAHNVGHFGLGFGYYSHFTSPIRRYADLILHRLIKTQLRDDKEEAEYLLRNIDPLCVRVSELERETTKTEWDFRDRKFARWAEKQKGMFFEAEVIEAGESAKAVLKGEIQGVTVNLRGDNIMLFDKVRVMITEVNIAQAVIMAELVNKLEKEITEL